MENIAIGLISGFAVSLAVLLLAHFHSAKQKTMAERRELTDAILSKTNEPRTKYWDEMYRVRFNKHLLANLLFKNPYSLYSKDFISSVDVQKNMR